MKVFIVKKAEGTNYSETLDAIAAESFTVTPQGILQFHTDGELVASYPYYLTCAEKSVALQSGQLLDAFLAEASTN